MEDDNEDNNPINVLNTYFQKKKQPLPVFNLKKETGPSHDKTFFYECKLSDGTTGEGSAGPGKVHGKKAAAKDALTKLRTKLPT